MDEDGDQVLTDTELAARRAQSYAPRPGIDPVAGGITGAGAVGLVLAGYFRFSYQSPWDSPLAVLVIMAVGFIAPWWYLRQRSDAHNRAALREFKRILAARTRNNQAGAMGDVPSKGTDAEVN